jgi:hypothetical protein
MKKRFATKCMVAAAGLVLIVGLFSAAHAAGTHLRQHAKRLHRQPAPGVRERREGAWQPHDSGALPFGSGRWWEQMLREGRINGDTM